MKIIILGVRGIPNVQGGVETHTEQLCRRLVQLGCDVEVIVRTPFVPRHITEVSGIRILRIWAPSSPGIETFVHSLLGVVVAAFRRPDILHIQAIGPSIVTPLARLFGLRVVVTNHGPDYDRDKWRAFARYVLRLGESYGMRYSHARIAISRVIHDLIRSRYGVTSDLIPNGVSPAPLLSPAGGENQFGLEQGRYFLQVSRFVPEKRQLQLIAAFKRASLPGWKLALVGAIDESEYGAAVRAAAAGDEQIVFTGYLSGVPLQRMYADAGAFVLPSTHEGLPIAILEALSHGLPVVASDIAANLEMDLGPECYFPAEDLAALVAALERRAATTETPEIRESRRVSVLARYNWDIVAAETLAVYRRVARAAG